MGGSDTSAGEILCPIDLPTQHKNPEGPQWSERVLTDEPRSKLEKVATVDEISEAIEKLLPEEWAKLYAYAKNRARMMVLYGAALDAEDLVQSAITALLEQRRTWNPKKVTFIGVLMGAMKSIASNHREKSLKSGYSVPESQFASGDEDGESETPVELHPDSRLNPEQQILTSEAEQEAVRFVEDLYAFLGEDLEALLVMDCWKEGLSGTEIIQSLEIDRKSYETIVRRIRRKSTAQWPKGSSHVS